MNKKQIRAAACLISSVCIAFRSPCRKDGLIPETADMREELRRRLHATCAEIEAWESLSETLVPAAVLVGLVAHPEGPSVILTQRTEHLENHPGQISLPGGRVEAGDSGPAEAALREAFEEIGLASEKVELLGCLPPHDTVTGFRVYPFVGWIEPPVEFRPDSHEVADVFQVPLSFVLDPANHHRDSIIYAGEDRSFYVLPYPGRHIWGATAAMLVSLARLLSP